MCVTLLCVKCSLGKYADWHKFPTLQLHDLACIKTAQNFSKLYHLSALPPSQALLWALFLTYLPQNITYQASLHERQESWKSKVLSSSQSNYSKPVASERPGQFYFLPSHLCDPKQGASSCEKLPVKQESFTAETLSDPRKANPG